VQNILIAGCFLFLFLVRFYRLGYHDFWFDEIWSTKSFPRSNWNAPLYWMLMHLWVKLFGISEFILRVPSACLNYCSVILIYILGKKLFNKTTGLIAAIFMGLSPFHLWYAQEARDYSMVLFFSIASSGLFYLALNENKAKLWVFFVISSLLAFYTNYFFGFLLISQGIFLLLCKGRLNTRALISFLIVGMGFSFYSGFFLEKFYYVREGFWVPNPHWQSFGITFENFLLGYNGSVFLYLAADILVVVLLTSALVAVFKKHWHENETLFCWCMFLVPILMVFIFSQLYFSIYLDRALIIFTPYFYLILASGVKFLPKKLEKTILFIAIFLISVSAYRYFNDQLYPPLRHHLGVHIKKPIKPIVRLLETKVTNDDIVVYTNMAIIPSMEYYLHRNKKDFRSYYFYDPALSDEVWRRPNQESLFCVPFDKINKLLFRRLWIVCSNWERTGQLDENSIRVKKWLDENFVLGFAKEIENVWIFSYAKNGT